MMDEYKCIVTLTCEMNPTKFRPNLWKPDLDSHIRACASAYLYYALVHRPLILISGGKIKGQDQASLSSILKEDMLRLYSIPEDKILLEEKSVDTIENAKYCAEILRTKGIEKIIVVTNEYHISRVRTCFRRRGLDAAYLSAEMLAGLQSKKHKKFIDMYLRKRETKKKKILNNLYQKFLLLPYFGEKVMNGRVHTKLKMKGLE